MDHGLAVYSSRGVAPFASVQLLLARPSRMP